MGKFSFLKQTQVLFNWGVLLIVLALSIVRQPLFFTSPRLWAEEGAVYIQTLLDRGFLNSLFRPHLGYYSLFNNFVVGLGLSIVGLEKIAYVTTYLSYFVILLTVLAPIFLPSPYWDSYSRRFTLVLASLTIGNAEIWVNTINSQFYFCLFSCFLFLSNTEKIRGWRSYYVVFMTLIGAFTGVTTIVLLPFYFWKYFKNEKKTELTRSLLLILVAGTVLQTAALFQLISEGQTGRFQFQNIKNFPLGVYHNLSAVIPSMGRRETVIMSIFTFMIIVFGKVTARFKFQPIVLAVYISCIFAFLSLEMMGGARYGYAPAVLIFLFLLNTFDSGNKYYRLAVTTLTSILFLFSLSSFFQTRGMYNPTWVRYSLKNAHRDASGDLQLKIFPQWQGTNWVLKLPPRDWDYPNQSLPSKN